VIGRDHSLAQPLLALQIGVLLGLGVVACGSASGGRVSPPYGRLGAPASAAPAGSSAITGTQAGGYVKGDGDADGANGQDADDATTRGYGHPASALEARIVAALVRRYYAAAAAGDGELACSLIYSVLASPSKLPRVAESYAPAPSAPPLAGKSCGYIMSLLFRENHRQLVADAVTLELTGVRVEGRRCLVLLAFKSKPERELPLEREHGAWKVASLFDEELA
jgi:hypothetical protein